MRGKYLVLALGLLAGCAGSSRQQAEAAVSRYLRATVHDPGSFETVRFESRPYTRQDSASYAARVAARRLQAGEAGPAKPPGPADTTHIGWLVKLTYRVRNGYNAATAEQGTFVVYPPDVVVPVSL